MNDSVSLESRLAKIREAASQHYPQLMALVRQLVTDLEASVIPHVLKVGDRAPDFELRDAQADTTVRLSSSLKRGPVVLSFYRGHW